MLARARATLSAVGRARALLLGVSTLLAAGCGTAADASYAGLASYRPPSNDYVLRYLAPPWQVQRSDGTALRLIIERDGTRSIDSGVLVIVPKYILDVTVVAASARALADADVAAAPGLGEMLRAGPRPIVTDSGDMGFDVLTVRTTPTTRFRRYASFDSARGGAVRLVFEGNPDLDDPEITQMIRQLDVAPEAP